MLAWGGGGGWQGIGSNLKKPDVQRAERGAERAEFVRRKEEKTRNLKNAGKKKPSLRGGSSRGGLMGSEHGCAGERIGGQVLLSEAGGEGHPKDRISRNT